MSSVSESTKTMPSYAYYGLITGGIVGTVLSITSVIMLSTIQGNKDDWSTIKTKSINVMLMIFGACLALIVAAMTYYYSNPQYGMYVLFVMVVLTFGVSLSALSTALIKKA